ncbi:hypothetical protein CRD59_00925 [Bifidobacterium xylocopae]|uniref:Uncharacterized protein n=1 Tax=Bifidobacterium xylocopae TaxID=2493119 RepID=A0A366KEB0_9BIFI|nr:hypothetical protein [Bifidobacterium xylocopae]RBQ00057.1 hypothetical protein CRD59_00925 [Bifidobacterium xylocopae]
MTRHYLSLTQVAQQLGISKSALAGYKLPPPDATIGTIRGWEPHTIEAWDSQRPGHGGRPRKR